MMRLAVGVEYDGTAYAGWQTQQSARSVQQVTEAAFSRIAAEPVGSDLRRAYRCRCARTLAGRSLRHPREPAPARLVAGSQLRAAPRCQHRLGTACADAFSCALFGGGAHLSLPDPEPRHPLGFCREPRRLHFPAARSASAWRRPRPRWWAHTTSAPSGPPQCQAKSPIRRDGEAHGRAAGGVGRDRGHRERLSAPHDAQYRGPAHRDRQGRRAARPGRGRCWRAGTGSGTPRRRPRRACTSGACATRPPSGSRCRPRTTGRGAAIRYHPPHQ